MFVIMLQKEIKPVSKTSKSSSSDLEIEIAELLYGLKTSKSHESSKKFEASVSPSDLTFFHWHFYHREEENGRQRQFFHPCSK